MEFKDFLINEEKSYLSHRIGDVLTALHDLDGDLDNLGSRQLNRMAEAIVNQIRRILHSQWSDKQIKTLKNLQKIGVGIMRAIDEKGDIKAVIKSATQELEGLSGKMGEPVSDVDMKGKPAKLKEPEPEKPAPEAGGMPGQMPDPGLQPGMPPMQGVA